MNWITVLWPMLAAVYLTFALLHIFIWAKNTQQWTNLSFAVAAVAIAVVTGMELMAMRTASIEQMSMLMRWIHLPVLVLWLAILFFVRCYFGAGRLWLAWTGGSMRLLALILSFTTGQNLFFNEITSLKKIRVWGGETVSIAQGELNPWYVVGLLSTLLLAVFVLDAAATSWRQGTDTGRRRGILFSGGITFFLLTAPVHTALVNAGLIDSPYIVSLSFLPIVLAMSYELSCDLLRSVQLAQSLQKSETELRASEQRISLAASAVDLRLWEWDIVRDEIWSTDKEMLLYGMNKPRKISFESFLNLIHEEDRQRVRLLVAKSLQGNGNYESEYRIKTSDDQVRWFHSRGRVEFSEGARPLRMHGVSIDITPRKQAELEVQLQRSELMHLARVSMLGELSGALAHELNQPLAAILTNAQAAQRFLVKDQADLSEVKDILNDIAAESKRGGDIIHRLRLLLRKCEVQRQQFDVNKEVEEVLKIMNSDLVNHNITVTVDFDQKLPAIIGDRVQFQQVMLNLIMNASEAMSHNASKRQLDIRTELTDDKKVLVSVGDVGPGISLDILDNIFKPFVSSKLLGMGLGLPICRNIITAHGGQLWAANNGGSGAVFHFTLPTASGEKA